jgi:hypothetical protein
MLAETRADPTPDTTRLSEFSAEPENSHGAGSAHQTLRGSWRQALTVAASDSVGLHAACEFSRFGEDSLSRGVSAGKRERVPARMSSSRAGARSRFPANHPQRSSFASAKLRNTAMNDRQLGDAK